MKILVSGTTLNVNSAYAKRDNETGIITLYVIVPYSEMDYISLKALFNDNTEDIVATKDDGSSETFSGFVKPKVTDDDETQVYTVKMTSDEHSFQLGRNRQLEADKANLEAVIATKDTEIAELLTIAEEYADMLYTEALEEIEIESGQEESEEE